MLGNNVELNLENINIKIKELKKKNKWNTRFDSVLSQ
jgi:hypothetical protein